LRIGGRVAEHLAEDRGNQFGGLLLGFATQEDDALSAAQKINDSKLIVQRWEIDL
jgi:hypothetical protein